MNNEKIFKKEFYLNEYELKEKRLSLTNFLLYYDIDFILNNDIKNHFELEFLNYNEFLKDYENPYYELDIFQYYIIKENDKELFEKYTNYPIFYCYELDLYLIGITHYNIGFSLVLTQKSFTDLYIIDKSTNKKVYFNGIENYSFKW